MKEGYYWARYKIGNGKFREWEVVKVFHLYDDVFGDVFGVDYFYSNGCSTSIDEFDFGANPQPIEMPEWCKEG